MLKLIKINQCFSLLSINKQYTSMLKKDLILKKHVRLKIYS
jgi:hypothetical protein